MRNCTSDLRSTVVGTTAAAALTRSGWPAKHPSPKKSPGPSMATTASFPIDDTRSRASLHLEILALRHQLAVLNRTRRPRLRLTSTDRLLWAWLTRMWRDWRSALHIVKPDTVVGWHRRGFRLFWTWKSRRRSGRPGMAADVRALIRELSTANPLWGAPRIHGELQKLGIVVSQSTVAKYMQRHPRPPSQTWRTFLTNHASQVHGRRPLRRADGHLPTAIRAGHPGS